MEQNLRNWDLPKDKQIKVINLFQFYWKMFLLTHCHWYGCNSTKEFGNLAAMHVYLWIYTTHIHILCEEKGNAEETKAFDFRFTLRSSMDNTPEAGLRAGSIRASLKPNECGKHLLWDNLFIIAILLLLIVLLFYYCCY